MWDCFTKFSRIIRGVVSALLIVAGSLYLLGTLVITERVNSPGLTISPNSPGATALASKPQNQVDFGIPVKLSIPDAGIDITVRPGFYDTKKQIWTIDKTNAFYMHGSNNTVIYAHNKNHLFGNLNKLSGYEKMSITNDAGNESTYDYVGNFVVKPNEADFLAKTEPGKVYLITCTGLFDRDRRISVFSINTDSANQATSKVVLK